ncbi:UDP-2,3-diacylglucosamine diphosphatase [Arcobacter sp. F2176]|jgi:UDP-2,3-diacylglucosamine pyrophosphatase LpxH|uniref:UDP-2,3-diacylglucosamine diphosphatase n=1 Tax=Arcobacter TaxID=28196 RepID=UPI00100B6974|nr:UDP-2,3-diacylglucosamine diphosphatase [Arcobacter sp. F2176]RXJ80992.1 UDP-2,3-diacylglucosamine hydrolase [Arcobacter sp. F2176]|tara:strand:+ start:145 stop:873 length:729 start_codon:yes stop_codon:yes gene_type:complete
MKYKSIFISDVHLGTRFSQAEKLIDFLKDNESENLFLVGDIIDGWSIRRKFVWPQAHSDVIQKVLRKARKGTNVYLITGNHDEFLRPFVPLILGDNLEVSNEFEYISISGKSYYVTHGDFFDSITMTKKWLAILGDYGYDFLLYINFIINRIRKTFKINSKWSLSKFIKDNVKSSVNFINDFEKVLTNHAKHKGYDGIICGHIHKAEQRDIEGIEYKNCGDWVESCTALVETYEGKFEIITW